MLLELFRALPLFAPEHGRCRAVARYFDREVRSRQHRDRMFGQHFREDLSHAHATAMLDAFRTAKKDRAA